MKGNVRVVTLLAGLALALFLAAFDPYLAYLSLFLVFLSQCIWVGGRDVSFLSVHYAALTIYCSLAPALQYKWGVNFWGVPYVGESDYVKSLIVIVLYVIGFEIFGFIPRKKIEFKSELNIYKEDYLALLLISAAAFAMLFLKPELSFFVRGMDVESRGVRIYEVIFYSYIPKSILMISLSLAVIGLIKAKGRSYVSLIVTFLIAIMALFGASFITTPRQLMLICFLPMVFLIFEKRINVPVLLALWFGVVLLGPVVNFFSRGMLYGVALDYFPFSPDFDATYVASVLLRLDGEFEIGFGRYLIGALSFFLPRELKPFDDMDPLKSDHVFNLFDQANVSTPPFVTGYLDFGYAGALFIGFIARWGFHRLSLWAPADKTGIIFYALLISSYVPMLRGPILGWGQFLISSLLALLTIRFLLKRLGARV